MNIRKSEFKIAHTQSWAARMSEFVQGAKSKIEQLRGALDAYRVAAKKLEEQKALYDKQLEDGEITAEQCAFAKRVTDRCRGALISLGDSTQTGLIAFDGQLAAYNKIDAALNKELTDEAEKVQNFLAAVDRGEVTVEPDGTARVKSNGERVKAPSKDLAARRAEAAAKWAEREKETAKPAKKKRKKRKSTKAKGESVAANP